MILRDFQIGSSAFPPAEARAINCLLFPVYEAVRLNLAERRPKAPFQKILLTFVDSRVHPDVRVTNALSICEVSLPVDIESFLSGPDRLGRSINLAVSGLKAVAESTGFEDPGLAQRLEQCGRSEPPCAHQFLKLSRVHQGSGTRCETWFVAQPGHSAVEVRLFTSASHRAIQVCCRDGPLYLEDDFPVRTARLRGERYELLDADREVLADVSVLPSPNAG